MISNGFYLGKGVADKETATNIYKLLLFLHFHLPGDTLLGEQASHCPSATSNCQTRAPPATSDTTSDVRIAQHSVAAAVPVCAAAQIGARRGVDEAADGVVPLNRQTGRRSISTTCMSRIGKGELLNEMCTGVPQDDLRMASSCSSWRASSRARSRRPIEFFYPNSTTTRCVKPAIFAALCANNLVPPANLDCPNQTLRNLSILTSARSSSAAR